MQNEQLRNYIPYTIFKNMQSKIQKQPKVNKHIYCGPQ